MCVDLLLIYDNIYSFYHDTEEISFMLSPHIVEA